MSLILCDICEDSSCMVCASFPPAVPSLRDPVVEANRKMLLDRSQLGIRKYGVMLNRADLDHRAWLQHALEEALDLANYLQAAIQQLDREESDRRLSEDLRSL